MRTASPDLRTLPSTKCATPSFCPISWAVAFLPLNENADVRAATCIPGIFCSTVKQLFADAVGKIFAPFVVAQVDEWQHGDGFLIGRICWSGRQRVSRHRRLIFTRVLHPPPHREQRKYYENSGGKQDAQSL